MKVLLVKTSSLGDVIHVMPAITEALANVADLNITWVVEEAFCDIAALHPGVSEVIPVAVRRWRKSPVACWGEIQAFRRRIGSEQYDLVIDSQGLIKSALIASSANGPRHGFDADSAREKAATWLYFRKQLDEITLAEAAMLAGLPKAPSRYSPISNYPKAKRYTDFRKMFDEMANEIDAVVVSTPDHTHFAATMAAMQLGKHVYVEKPLAHNIWQLRTLKKAAKHTKYQY